MSVLAHTSCRLTRVRNANSRTEKGRPRNRTKYAYDAAGDTLSDSTDTDTYNDAGRLKTIANTSGTTTFIYNALGQVIDASGPSGTTLYVYDQTGHVLGEYGGSGNLIQETVWLGDIPVATIQPSSSSVAIYYVETDQLDTPRAVIRPSDNALMWSWFTGPFGIEAPNTNPQGAGAFTYDLRFPGQIAGAWGSTYQNGWRDLDPTVGRYVESDPIGLRGASFSTYAYVDGNPLSYVDPLGLAPPLPPGVLPPPPNVPGGPWSWSPNPQNPRGGLFVGPKQPRGGRAMCIYTAPGPENPEPYWKVTSPNGAVQRWNQFGEPITPSQAHPGARYSLMDNPWLFLLFGLTYSEPAY